MWPFSKKDDDLESFEKELGLANETSNEEPMQEPQTDLPKQDDLKEEPTFKPMDNPEGGEPKPQQPVQESNETKLISAKLDTIKAMLETINHRLDNLEKKDNKKVW